MSDAWKEISPEEIADNTFKLIGSDWMLITAGSLDSYNTMTASWGGFGILWGKPVCWCVVRPQRYTYEFMERAESFTLSFYGDEFRDALALCGSKSGRDIDKAAATGLTPIAGGLSGTTTFAQARMTLDCRKIYTHDVDPTRFLSPEIDSNYPGKDYHRMYIAEIVHCRVK